MPTTQRERAERLLSLHVKGDPLILFNIWDAGSAKAIEEIGAKAIATGSWSVAAANGFEDGEQIPLELVIGNTQRIVAAVALPVSIDFEGGYGTAPSDVHASLERLIKAGAVGMNFEDQVMGGDALYSVADQSARISAARAAAEEAALPFFINARTDLFLRADPARHSEFIEEAERRAAAYAEAGARGLFAPGLRDARLIERLCKSSALPVNILVLPETPSLAEMAALGVARVSYGPRPYRLMIDALKKAGRKALGQTNSLTSSKLAGEVDLP